MCVCVCVCVYVCVCVCVCDVCVCVCVCVCTGVCGVCVVCVGGCLLLFYSLQSPLSLLTPPLPSGVPLYRSSSNASTNVSPQG